MAVSEEESSSAKSRSNGVHYLAKCVLRGTVVLQVVQGHIRSPSSNDVVFGKETSIELVVVDEDGIAQSICEQPVFGTIKALAILPWNEDLHARSPQMTGKDLLVVISDSGKLSFLTFSNEMHRFFPLPHIELSAPGNSRYQVGRMLAVDSSGCFIAASAYEDRLAMFSVSMSAGSDIIDKAELLVFFFSSFFYRIFYPSESEEDSSTSRGLTSICGTIWSMCFISRDFRYASKEYNPVLAIILNRRGSFLNELLLLEWNMKEHAVHVISQFAEAGPLAHNVVEVPHSYGFAFLFRVGDALLMDLRDAHNPCCVHRITLSFLPSSVEEHNFVEESCRVHDADEIFNVAALLELGALLKNDDPMSIDGECDNLKSISNHVCSWSWEPGNGENPRMIFCVDSGELFMFEITFDSNGPRVDLSECLYKGLPCKALLWVEDGFLAALVEMGDGMVLKLEDGRLDYRSPIQNIAPILDISVMDYHDEKHDQVFACCGMAPEGSLRIIRSGISVEKLLRTAPIYQGITGTWTVKMKASDLYHSLLVLSFVEQTKVLSVGISFTDVTDTVGFQPDVCTLACGLVDDGLLVQIYQSSVRLCLPIVASQPEASPSLSPICTSWSPDNINISLGAVGHHLIVVATSSPSFLFILGVRSLSACHWEVYEMQHVQLQDELSCVSIPWKHFEQKPSTSRDYMGDKGVIDILPAGVDIGNTFVIGTHKPSVEVLSFQPNKGLQVLGVGSISLTNTVGTAISGCVPQDVRLVLVDRLYVLSGLRNGMLLRFEWPATSTMFSFVSSNQRPCISSCLVNLDASLLKTGGFDLSDKSRDNPVHLQLIAIRRIGITPAFLIPLSDSLDADIIALSDKPWLLQTARHSLSYTSISFQPSTHVTPVSSVECPKGILFVAENSLHLVEMVHTKGLNVQKFHLGGTPRKVLYHSESRLLLVMRTELSHDSSSSDICCVDPLSGSILSSFRLDPGETGKCMDLVRVGNEQVLVIGTSLSAGPAIMPSGEAESTRGRLIVLCLEHMQNSDSASVTFCSKAGSSSQRTSPFREIVGYAAEQLSSSSLRSSPDDNSFEGIKLEETESWHLRLACATIWPGMVLAVCPYLDRYFLASAGNAFYVCGFPNDNSQRVRRLAVGRTRFMIMTLTAHFTRIAVGDCRDGILFYTYHENARKLDQLYCDPVQRLVADCILMDVDTAVVSDRKGSIAVLSCSNQSEDNASPERNLTRSCSFYMGEIAVRIKKGSFSYKLPADDILKGFDVANTIMDLSHNSIMASTLLGSIIVFIPISRYVIRLTFLEEHALLEALQARLVVHPLTAPILGNDHNEFRSRESSAGVPKILDGDMLAQFLELTSMQQEAVLELPMLYFQRNSVKSLLQSFDMSPHF
ncbi:hypothetical protein RHSIM_Rhsim03G0002200 [Rhododendron simsii]|uniref:Uncharacterized protein n=1 Tax=Rhododendron simsii TaxID=118357 RepID=A0A834LV91_RHOSS|nr:hypothetical protein RHSIM_Rhsim03G0002200 [Rhododendron simsii]